MKSMTNTTTQRGSLRRRLTIGAGIVLGASTLTGCDNAGQGLFTGAALGAAAGTALGSIDGNAGEGALYGAIIGGLGGAILGDQNERNANGGYTERQIRDYGYGDGRGSRHHRHHDRHDPWWEDDCDDW